MDNLNIFIWSSTILTGFLGAIWNTSNLLNTVIKAALLFNAVGGIVILFSNR